jgi:hypothetical protein
MHYVGWHNVCGLSDVYMIQKENSQELNFKHYWKNVTLQTLALVQNKRQSNAIVENVLITLLHGEPPKTLQKQEIT